MFYGSSVPIAAYPIDAEPDRIQQVHHGARQPMFTTDMLQEANLPARAQYALEFLQGLLRRRDAAKNRRSAHGIEAGVFERKVLPFTGNQVSTTSLNTKTPAACSKSNYSAY